MAAKQDFSGTEHDWQSPEYVSWWIERDAARDAERRTRLRHMLQLVPFGGDTAASVLDVGGGYGVLTEEVLHSCPRARVTLQDYSRPMLDAAQQRLGADRLRVSCVCCDLYDPSWTDQVGGPFDLAVSSIAIHNLRDLDKIAACYRGIAKVLKPGAPFLDYDIYGVAGGTPLHMQMLREAGFARVDCAWEEPPAAILAAYKAG